MFYKLKYVWWKSERVTGRDEARGDGGEGEAGKTVVGREEYKIKCMCYCVVSEIQGLKHVNNTTGGESIIV